MTRFLFVLAVLLYVVAFVLQVWGYRTPIWSCYGGVCIDVQNRKTGLDVV